MPKSRVSTVAVVSVLAATAFGPHPVLAQSFDVGAGQVAGPQTMTGAGDTGTVRAGGSIDTTSGDAVQMFNSGQNFTNDGSVATSGNSSADVNSQGDDAVIVNNGSIFATGDGSAGILAAGAGAWIENSGTIAASGIASFGIIGSGNDLTVFNSGAIQADGEAADGIIWEGDGLRVDNSGSVVVSGLASVGIGAGGTDVVIDNSGLVDVSGDESAGIESGFGSAVINNSGSIAVNGYSIIGILALGDSAVVDNSGSIQASGDLAVGIGVASASASITNSGSIVTDGIDNVALSTLGDGVIVTNSGRIISDQGLALYFGGSDATLNLLAGTAIQGPIVFSGGGNTATFGPGISAAMTFSGTGVPETVLTGGRPFVIKGDTVAVADITGFASAGAVVEDLTGSVADAVGQRLSDLRGSGTYSTSAAGSHAWLSTFGTGRSQRAAGAASGFSDSLGGVIVGFETNATEDIVAGAFVGAAGGKTEIDHDAQDITHRSVFGGGYLGYDSGARFADFSLTLGTLDESSRRRVANNLVLGGIEMARADFDGTFVSPSLTLGTRMPYGTSMLEPSVRLRYAGLFLGDYAETGSAGGLAVAGRDVHVFEARGQLALALAPITTSAGIWQTTWRAGVDGFAQSAGDISATLLGQDIAFDAGARKTALRGFVGTDLSLSAKNGMTFGADVETAYGSDNAFIARAGAHLAIAF